MKSSASTHRWNIAQVSAHQGEAWFTACVGRGMDARAVSDRTAKVTGVMDEGGVPVSVGRVLDVLGGIVLLVPDSTLDALTCQAREAFVAATEVSTRSVVFVVPDEVLTDV